MLPDNRDSFKPRLDDERSFVAPMLAIILAFGVLAVGIVWFFHARNERAEQTVAERIIAMQEAAVRDNCVIFSLVEGYPSEQQAIARARAIEMTLANYAREDSSIESQATKVVGSVTMPSGDKAYIVASVAQVCFERGVLPIGG
jgi:hypothetical protein